jgi:Fic family protein
LVDASLALGRLSGIGTTLQDPDILIDPLSRAEAVSSSKIEGTVTSTPELLMLELAPHGTPARSDTREVHNYNVALKYGLQRISSLPFSKRLFNELHHKLLQGVAVGRGAALIPGEIRKDQNWIGARTIQNARFIPPPPMEVMKALDDLEVYANLSDSQLPLLIKLALIHYQFETIHPYPDGNGRVGRLLIPILLGDSGAMSKPLLYLSPFFERNYNEYIDLMLEVSRRGAWHEWIIFFMRGIVESSNAATEKISFLQNLHSKYMEQVRAARSSALLTKAVDSLFRIPAITVPHAARELDVSYNAAKNIIQRLVDLKIITPAEEDFRPQWYFSFEIMKVARVEASYYEDTQ